MCGIMAMVADSDVVSFLVNGLKIMEYRGYDSSGIAIEHKCNGKVDIIRHRAKGKLSALNDVIAKNPVSGNAGIGHIRWATHGEPTDTNAHPHASKDVNVVHNGIIENWQDIKKELINQGYIFSSQTDSEVIAYLIQSHLDKGLSALEAFRNSIKQLEGTYAIAVMIKSTPGTIYVARFASPLIIGEGSNAMYAGSDALALAMATNKVCYLEEGDYAVLTKDSKVIYDKDDTMVNRELVTADVCIANAEKGDFPHFMLKEIHEQPDVVINIIDKYIDRENLSVKPLAINFAANETKRLSFVACGSAYHAAMIGSYWIESLARLNVDVNIASEYRYRDLIKDKDEVFIGVSQSGETADTLAALKRARQEGKHIIAIVNVASSSIARESDDALLIHAGVEIGVASTKSFIAQILVILCLAIYLGRQRGVLSRAKEQEIVKNIMALPNLIKKSIDNINTVKYIANNIALATNVLFLGRGKNYPIALEAALKLKEISYIHAEGYASGEMKHGAIALIDENMPVICLCPDDDVLEKSLSNMQEVIARKAQVTLVANKDTCRTNLTLNQIIMPDVDAITSPILYLIPMQLLSYYTALALGRDIDQPRNLAKSVTVE